MLKDLLLVGIGSFFGGGLRFLISKLMDGYELLPSIAATFIVNILGCLLLGYISGLWQNTDGMNPTTKLILTTGFCGGFTTFSTFMNENLSLLADNNYLTASLYIIGSLGIGLLAVMTGMFLSKL